MNATRAQSSVAELEEAPLAKAKPGRDARRRPRIKVSLAAHIRPFEPRLREIEDIGLVENFTRDGLHFTTLMLHYFIGMRLEITFPHGGNIVARRKYVGSIVRLEDHGNGTSGVSVKFLF